MRKIIGVAVAASILAAGCASSPDNISAHYVSPVIYRGLTCSQVEQELTGIGSRVDVLTGQQRRRASQDRWATGVGLVIFWPALFFLMRGDKAEELGRLKGQYDALHLVSQEKGCGMAIPAPAAS